MEYFKIKTLPGTTWPIVPDPNISVIWSAYQSLTQTQWLKPEELLRLQLQQINTLLEHCRANVPYYKNLPRVSSLADFQKIPFLTRQLYQSNFEKIKAIQVPNGMIVGKHSTFTSGTNGVPIEVLKTNRDELWWLALTMRDIEWNKLDPLKKIASIRLIAMSAKDLPDAMEGISASNWLPILDEDKLFETGPGFALDIRQSPRQQIEWLKKVQPAYLISLPSNLDVLASILQESNQKINNLEKIQTIGETLEPDVKLRIEKAFGVPVVNLYSANECGYIASQCPSGEGMHVHAEHVFTEVINDNNLPCQPGETGRLVLTNLSNFATPFIRYELLDRVTLADKPCSCGRGLPLWKSIEGRYHPMLFLANGERKISTGLMLGIRQVGGVHQFQVIQKDINRFTIRVVPNKEWTPQHTFKMIQCVRDEVESLARVDIEECASLGRPNGKLKIIDIEMETKSWTPNYKPPGVTSQLIGINGRLLFAHHPKTSL